MYKLFASLRRIRGKNLKSNFHYFKDAMGTGDKGRHLYFAAGIRLYALYSFKKGRGMWDEGTADN